MRSKIFTATFVLPKLLRLFQDLSELRMDLHENDLDYDFQIVEMQYNLKKLIETIEKNEDN